MARAKWRRRAVQGTVIGLTAGCALYAVGANVFLSSGALRALTNVAPEELRLDYARAWSAWPGRVHAREVTLRFQDQNVQFFLQLDEVEVDVAVLPLLRRQFHATRVRGTGASWRMLLKGAPPARLAASPTIEGFARDPERAAVAPPHPPLDQLWSVELEDVAASVREVWVMEFAWTGVGHVEGGFALAPLQRLQVRPAHLALERGVLAIGAVKASSDFSLHADVDVAPYDIATHPDLEVFRPISASVQVVGPLDDVSFVRGWLPGVSVTGRGALDADVRLIEGRLGPATTAALRLDHLEVDGAGVHFHGVTTLGASMDLDGLEPVAGGEVGGVLQVELDGEPVSVRLNQVVLDAKLSGRDLVDGLGLEAASAHVIAAQVDDARPLRAAAAKQVAVLLPELLGDGPLVFSGTAYLTPAQTLVQLTDAKLGAARLRGVAVRDDGEPWRAAAAGHVAGLTLGVKLVGEQVVVLPFIKPQWLGEEFERMRLDPNLAEPSPLAAFNLK